MCVYLEWSLFGVFVNFDYAASSDQFEISKTKLCHSESLLYIIYNIN